jgi:hypothetical protein
MPTYMRWLAITYAPTVALACAAVLPCGVDRRGLPFGIQVIGRNGADAFVLEVAHALEEVLAANRETARPVPDLASPAFSHSIGASGRRLSEGSSATKTSVRAGDSPDADRV